MMMNKMLEKVASRKLRQKVALGNKAVLSRMKTVASRKKM